MFSQMMEVWQLILWGTASSKPALGVGIGDRLIQQLLAYFQLPTHYHALVEWSVRGGVAFFLLLFVAFLARRKRIERMVAWIDERVGLIELQEVDRRLFAFLLSSTTWLFGFLVILGVLKLHTLLATLGLSAGALATVAALANKEFIGHFFSGFALQARGQIRPNDQIEVMGVTGVLQHIGMTACQIEDADGVVHFIPNSKMLSEKLANYSMSKTRRLSIRFVYDPTSLRTEEMEALLSGLLEEIPGQFEEKTGSYAFGGLSERGMEVSLSVFFDKENASVHRSKAICLFQEKLQAAGVRFGLTQQIVHLAGNDGEKKKGKAG